MAQLFTAFSSEVKINEETVEGLQSVSYTHLDVYKRQVYHDQGPDRRNGE